MQIIDDLLRETSSGREAARIIRALNQAGFVAYLAGGCVRDALLNTTPKDFDVATDARPDAVRDVFGRRHTLAFGASFGVIGVLPTRKATEPRSTPAAPTEVATFRADGGYSDGRRPDHVHFGTAEADAARRDFTINGMFYDVNERVVIDHVGGQDDLRASRLRTIGDATRRFDEDRLRMLRAVRFATTLQFQIEATTWQAIRQHASAIDIVSGERIGVEMQRIMTSPSVVDGLVYLLESELSAHVWPELGSMDLHAMRTRIARPPQVSFEVAMALAALSMSEAHSISSVLHHWKRSSAEQRAVNQAVATERRLRDCAGMSWSELQPILIDRDIDTTMVVAEAIAGPECAGIRRAKMERKRPITSLDPPPILTGDDLIQLGHRPGVSFKRWLTESRRMQLDGEAETKEEVIEKLRLGIADR